MYDHTYVINPSALEWDEPKSDGHIRNCWSWSCLFLKRFGCWERSDMTCVMVSLCRCLIDTIKCSHDAWSIGQTINQAIWGDATRRPNVEILIASTMREESAMRWLKSWAAVRAVGIGTGLRVNCVIGTERRWTGLLGFIQTGFIWSTLCLIEQWVNLVYWRHAVCRNFH